MSDPQWQYLRQGAMGLSADHMANPLRRSRLSHEELLMRESIQNSADERLEDSDEPVRFEVRKITLLGDDKLRFVDRFSTPGDRRTSHVFPRGPRLVQGRQESSGATGRPGRALPPRHAFRLQHQRPRGPLEPRRAHPQPLSQPRAVDRHEREARCRQEPSRNLRNRENGLCPRLRPPDNGLLLGLSTRRTHRRRVCTVSRHRVPTAPRYR